MSGYFRQSSTARSASEERPALLSGIASTGSSGIWRPRCWRPPSKVAFDGGFTSHVELVFCIPSIV